MLVDIKGTISTKNAKYKRPATMTDTLYSHEYGNKDIRAL